VTSEAGPKWRNLGHGDSLPMISHLRPGKAKAEPADGAGEARLVEGRRPGFKESTAFDEAVAEMEPGGGSVVRLSGRIVRDAATEDVRGYVASSTRGRQRRRRETQCGGATIEAPPGPRGVLAQWASGSRPQAPAKGVAATPKLEHRRQARLYPSFRTRGRKVFCMEARELDSLEVLVLRVGCRSWRGASFWFAQPARQLVTMRGQIVRSETPAFDEAGHADGGRQGAGRYPCK
jgi:hypothetical protein